MIILSMLAVIILTVSIGSGLYADLINPFSWEVGHNNRKVRILRFIFWLLLIVFLLLIVLIKYLQIKGYDI